VARIRRQQAPGYGTRFLPQLLQYVLTTHVLRSPRYR
jgi:hypothetical protein